MRSKTSWQSVSSWYDAYHKDEGGYYHREVILPRIKKLISFNEESKVLDLACGEGILARHLPKESTYFGIDDAPSLIKVAKEKDKSPNHQYVVGDVTRDLQAPLLHFTHALCILAIQNISIPKKVFANASKHLTQEGYFTLVLNHPCFRIPKHSSWNIDLKNQTQSRVLDRYLSPTKIQISTHPSQQEKSEQTVSFHRPLSYYFEELKEAGFYVEELLELCSNKKSYGKMARAENFARNEFPLFLVLHCKKISKK